VRSLVLVPIREADPIGAIGNYWSKPGRPPEKCVKLLQALANFTAIAIENVQTLEALRQSNESLASSLRSRDEFISIAAHELRTPLSALKLQLQLLGRKIEAPGETAVSSLRSAAVVSLQQTDRLYRLVENLLDVSSIRLGRVILSKEEVDLGALTEAVADRQRAALDRAGIRLSLRAEPGVRGSWDALRIEQILVNLFSNAIKYAPNASLTVEVKRDRSLAVIDFQDSGPGITKAHRQKIFERFERANTDERVSGLGLGLYLAKNLAQAHGGGLALEEASGVGACFRLELPLSSPPPSSPGA
jgi:two-component system OmpR family sensor kinase